MSLQTITEDDTTFQFTEYQHLIQTPKDGELYELFAYGKYNLTHQQILTPKQLHKIQLLTLISLCQENKLLQFQTIQTECGLLNQQSVEDLLIAAICQELIVGKIDQKQKCVLVDRAISRDIRKGDVLQMQNKIQELLQRTRDVRKDNK